MLNLIFPIKYVFFLIESSSKESTKKNTIGNLKNIMHMLVFTIRKILK